MIFPEKRLWFARAYPHSALHLHTRFHALAPSVQVRVALQVQEVARPRLALAVVASAAQHAHPREARHVRHRVAIPDQVLPTAFGPHGARAAEVSVALVRSNRSVLLVTMNARGEQGQGATCKCRSSTSHSRCTSMPYLRASTGGCRCAD